MRSSQRSTGVNRTRFSLKLVLSCLFISVLAWTGLSADLPSDDCEPKDCGDGLNISYPFWIEGRQSPSCGYPAFKLACKNSAAVLKIYDDDYLVHNIFYSNRSFIVSSLELVGSCPVPRYNFSLGGTQLSINPTNRYISFFLNCTELVSVYRIGCPGAATGVGPFVGNYSSPEQERYGRKNCKSFVVWPYRDDGGVGGDGNYSALLDNGFLLDWDVDDCSACEASGGRCRYDLRWSRFACVCSDRSHAISCQGRGNKRRKIAIGTIAGASSFLIACIPLYCWCCQKHCSLNPIWLMKSRNPHNIEVFLEQYGSIVPKRYRYAEVKKITKSFIDKLGQGGYGTVFKGKLQDGRLVAVKVLNKSKENGEEFMNEVASIGRTHHINIVNLLGFCCEGSKRALIYEFMSNGSLEKYIFLRQSGSVTLLSWKKLLEIAIGIARGLEYLHRGCNTHIVHFDIKPHNILLDEDFCPKISDFGLAKSCRPKQSILSTMGTRGTIGYIAPEVFSRSFGMISSKSDVYSYGMMVLQMVGGRKNSEVEIDNSSDAYFPHWIYDHFNDNDAFQLCGIVDETEEVARKMVLVGLWCIQTSPSSRPTMSNVLEMLEGNLKDVQMPPKPYLISP